LDILRCVSAIAAKLKINPRIRNYQNHKNPSQALHEGDKKSLKKWRSLAKPRREQQKNWTLRFSLSL